MEQNPDVKKCVELITKNAKEANQYFDYYNGNQKLAFSSEKMREIFKSAELQFTQNWCAAVIDSTSDRLTLQGWDNPNEATDDKLDTFYANRKLQLLSRQIHKDALITGNGYLMLDIIDGEVILYRNDPRTICVIYSTDRPDQIQLAAKMYQTEEAKQLILYYPDRIEVYKTASRGNTDFSFVEEMRATGIPLIHFQATPELRNIIPLQDAINKLYSDMMVVSEFNAFRQRYIVTNADISALEASPSTIMQIPRGETDGVEPTQVGEFSAADIGQYLDTIDKLTNAIAIISRTPKYYFMSTGANVSGETLMVMEAPLVKKVKQFQESFGQSWLDLARMAVIDDTATTVTWERPESNQPLSIAQAQQAQVSIGIPLVTVLRNDGWSKDEIDKMKADRVEEMKWRLDSSELALKVAMLRERQANNPLEPGLTQTEIGETE
jgi:hypothetical protein